MNSPQREVTRSVDVFFDLRMDKRWYLVVSDSETCLCYNVNIKWVSYLSNCGNVGGGDNWFGDGTAGTHRAISVVMKLLTQLKLHAMAACYYKGSQKKHNVLEDISSCTKHWTSRFILCTPKVLPWDIWTFGAVLFKLLQLVQKIIGHRKSHTPSSESRMTTVKSLI